MGSLGEIQISHEAAGCFHPPTGRGRGRGRGPGRRGSTLGLMAPPSHWIPKPKDMKQLLKDLFDPQQRGRALNQLSKLMRNKNVKDLSLKLWNTPMVVTLILQEILKAYRYIGSQELMPQDECNQVCDAISLLKPIVSDDRLKAEFLRASMYQYLYPFLRNRSQSKVFEFLRVLSLSIIGCLIGKSDSAVQTLLESGIDQLCFCCMEVGTDLTKSVSVNILERILSSSIGQDHFFSDSNNCFAIIGVLASLFQVPPSELSIKLLKHTINCYSLIATRVPGDILFDFLPDLLKEGGLFVLHPNEYRLQEDCYELLQKITKGKYRLPWYVEQQLGIRQQWQPILM